MAVVVTAATATDQGPVRQSNQDAVLVDGLLYAVSDGFGPAGGHASRIALEALSAGFAAMSDREGLLAAVEEANRQVWDEVRASGTSSGATLTVLALFGPDQGGPVVVNIGDSPLNRIRDGAMRQVTDDHSVSGELVSSGEITREEARFHPQRHLLTRALGIGPFIRPDVFELDCLPGDRLVLSSDGLFAAAADADVAAVATAGGDPQEVAWRLVQVSNDAGGSDNTSVIVIDIG